ncbi:MAG: nicotinate-nicotinamide nucleotide adenylyltransferase [Myxococcales bacterium]
MRVALLGGSFNPPHLAHVLCAAQILSLREPDELWIVPAVRHPFGKPLAPYADRLAMAELAIAPLGPRVRVSRAEEAAAAAGSRGTTVELLRHLRAVRPGDHFLLVVGSDILLEKDRWARFDEVTQLADLTVVNRSGFPAVPGAGAPLPGVSSTDIRDRLARGMSVEGLVPASVGRYLIERTLYASGAG